MSNVLTNSASIPYGTWGGVTRSSVTTTVDNPYTITNLQYNCKVNAFVNVEDTRTVITNMIYYAESNIPNYTTITSIPSGHLPTDINTSLAQDWYNAFSNCRNLTSLPDPFYDTSNATNMSWMFYHCRNLTTIPNFNTSNATSMDSMFDSCFNITTVPNFNTSKVTRMNSVFYYCFNLTTVPNFDTSNVTDMFYMFISCSNLTTVPNFDTSNVTDMYGMFSGCSNFTTIPNFDTSKVTDMGDMFAYCRNLTSVPNFNTSKVTNMSYMFDNCINIKGNLYIESNNVTNARNIFANTSNYTKNIYCHANTTTYNTIYNAMGNNTYNSNWNAYLKTMENDYAYIGISFTGGFDEPVYKIFRFPTNKIAVIRRNTSDPSASASSIINIIEVTPYTDYNIAITQDDLDGWISHNGVIWGSSRFTTSTVIQRFQFFKDITNMTPDIVDTI